MKSLIGICLLFSLSIFCACNQSTGPTTPQQLIHGTFTLDGYGEVLDSTYYKVWSDSSWESFYEDTTINGTRYSAFLDAYGDEYLYGPDGSYDGFWLYGWDLIIFNAPLPGVPDTMAGGVTYALTTTFSDQGVSYVLEDDETLLDTGSVTVPFGTFNNCLVLESVNTISSGSVFVAGSNTDYWLAKGPSDIQRWYIDIYTGEIIQQIQMAFGVVNGQSWGVIPPTKSLKRTAAIPYSNIKRPSSASRSGKSKLDLHSLGPIILKGIIR